MRFLYKALSSSIILSSCSFFASATDKMYVPSTVCEPFCPCPPPNCSPYEPCPPLFIEKPRELVDNVTNSTQMRFPEPIYIGGARYRLSKSDFNPIYERRFPKPCNRALPENPYINALVGYQISLPVDGDYGQNLIFDIHGRTNKTTKLKAYCGRFSGNDSGKKYVISKRQRTNGSCKMMNIELKFHYLQAPNTIDLNVTISEEFE